MPGKGRRRRSIGTLQPDVPVAELLERNGGPGRRAADETAFAQNLKIGVQISEDCLSGLRGLIRNSQGKEFFQV